MRIRRNDLERFIEYVAPVGFRPKTEIEFEVMHSFKEYLKSRGFEKYFCEAPRIVQQINDYVLGHYLLVISTCEGRICHMSYNFMNKKEKLLYVRNTHLLPASFFPGSQLELLSSIEI